ncbi:MAG: two-component regulator propeller domain-containing protein [Bacteroidota bacterium]|nr:two-component regulator propeller domain-containing protein [Bacteroidota bacterium]
MKKIIFITGFLLVILPFTIWSQVAMGKWSTHFAYNSVSQIAQSDNKIYAVSDGALFSVDKLDGNIEFYSKLSGLNDANISRIEYDSVNKVLLIIYTNGNIDMLTSGGVINLPDFYNKQMSSSKSVNHIQFYDNKAYLSCNFGIVVLNMQKKEVSDTYYIGPNASEVKVLSTTINNGIIYAQTASTIFYASATDAQLVNYAEWSPATGLPGTGDFQKIASFNGKLILLRGGYLWEQNTPTSWLPILPNVSVTNFNATNSSLNVFTSNSVYLLDNNYNPTPVANIGTISDAEYDAQNNIYYFAANSLGIISYKQNSTGTPTINYFKPAGPAVNMPWSMTFSGKKLFVVPGGRWADRYFTRGVVMMYENGVWTNINGSTIQNQTSQSVLDFLNVAVDPLDSKHFFVTSYGNGLFEFKNNVYVNWYNYTNSTISSIFPGNIDYMRLDGAIYDQNNNLFLTNTSVLNGIKVLLANGTWTQLYYPCVSSKPTLGQITISNQNPNQKWINSVRSTPGIAVFDDNGTITDQSDDKSVFIYPFTYPEQDDNGVTKLTPVYPNAVNTIVQDKNGVMWVGTDVGPFLFSNLANVYNSDYTCSRVKIPRNDSTNLADYLLVGENIQAIAVDGANRKWIGTKSSGVYLMSENGQQTIQHFTVSNSPILSNNIMSLAINPLTGEVFFGTDQGIVSYQSDANEAGSTFGNVYAYPNPVRQGYVGVITITGLMDNTQVKITDINGNLVCETVSNGSLATWDGKDIHGRKVSTGIYLAICANADGTQSTITKILVIN